MKKRKAIQITLLGIELGLGGIFVYSGLVKILNFQGFETVVRNYRLLPDLFVRFIAYVLPFVELVFGSMFMLGRQSKIAAYVLSSLLIIFIAALSIDLVRGINTSCGCFSLISDQGTKADMLLTILRDMLFITLFIFFHIYQKRRVNDEAN